MTNNELKIGDVVTLVTAGTVPMTVEKIEDIWITCIWFNKYDSLKRHAFMQTSLRKEHEWKSLRDY